MPGAAAVKAEAGDLSMCGPAAVAGVINPRPQALPGSQSLKRCFGAGATSSSTSSSRSSSSSSSSSSRSSNSKLKVASCTLMEAAEAGWSAASKRMESGSSDVVMQPAPVGPVVSQQQQEHQLDEMDEAEEQQQQRDRLGEEEQQQQQQQGGSGHSPSASPSRSPRSECGPASLHDFYGSGSRSRSGCTSGSSSDSLAGTTTTTTGGGGGGADSAPLAAAALVVVPQRSRSRRSAPAWAASLMHKVQRLHDQAVAGGGGGGGGTGGGGGGISLGGAKSAFNCVRVRRPSPTSCVDTRSSSTCTSTPPLPLPGDEKSTGHGQEQLDVGVMAFPPKKRPFAAAAAEDGSASLEQEEEEEERDECSNKVARCVSRDSPSSDSSLLRAASAPGVHLFVNLNLNVCSEEAAAEEEVDRCAEEAGDATGDAGSALGLGLAAPAEDEQVEQQQVEQRERRSSWICVEEEPCSRRGCDSHEELLVDVDGEEQPQQQQVTQSAQLRMHLDQAARASVEQLQSRAAAAATTAPARPTSSGSSSGGSAGFNFHNNNGGLVLVHHLLQCAQAADRADWPAAAHHLTRLYQDASLHGDSMQRIAAYFAESLAARVAGPASPLYAALTAPPPPAAALAALTALYQATPYLQFAHLTANQAVLEACAGAQHVHVVDLAVGQGVQWPALVAGLAARDGGAPASLRVTGVAADPAVLRDVKARLESFVDAALSETLSLLTAPSPSTSASTPPPQRMAFEFVGVAEPPGGLHHLTPRDLGCRPGEALAVNAAFRLHALPEGQEDGASFTKDADADGSDQHPHSPLQQLLRTVAALRPRVLTLVEHEGDHDAPALVPRFLASLHHYAALFDSLEAALPQASPARLAIEQAHLAPQIRNIVACEGPARLHRHAAAPRWRRRLHAAGFRQLPLSSSNVTQAKLLLRLGPGSAAAVGAGSGGGYRLSWAPLAAAAPVPDAGGEDAAVGFASLGWQDQPLVTASAWTVAAAGDYSCD